MCRKSGSNAHYSYQFDVWTVWILEPDSSTWRFHSVRPFENLMEKVVCLDFLDFYYFCKLRTCRLEGPEDSLAEKGGALVEFWEILVVTKKRDISEGILRWASNEAWGISRNVDVTLVTRVQWTLTIMTLITDLIEISTFLQFILLQIILVDNKFQNKP